jgi:hypothetical protein
VSRNRRQAQILGALGLAGAAALPWVLWRRAIREIFGEFRVDVHYLLQELTPWVLIALGLLFLLPVALSAGRDPDSRWYPQARNAYAGWGITLYLLGIGLGSQVAQLWRLTTLH